MNLNLKFPKKVFDATPKWKKTLSTALANRAKRTRSPILRRKLSKRGDSNG